MKIYRSFWRTLFFAWLFLLSACDGKNHREILLKADSYLRGQLDSVPFLLIQLPSPEELPAGERAHYYLIQTIYNRYSGHSSSSDSLIAFSENYYRSIADTARLGSALFQKAWMAYRFNRLDSAACFYQEALSLALLTNDSSRLCQGYRELSMLASLRGDTDSVIVLAQRSLRYGAGEQQMATFNYLGNVYADKKQSDEAEKCYRNALLIAEQEHSRDSYLRIRDKLMQLYVADGRHKEAFVQLDSFRRAMKWRLDGPYAVLAKATLWKEIHRYDSAHYYYSIASRAPNLYVAAEAHRQMAQLQAHQANYPTAYSHSWVYEQSLRTVESSSYYQEVASKFKKAQLENELVQAKLAKRTQEIYLLLVCIIFVVTASGGYLAYYRYKKGKAELLLREQTRLLENENRLLKQTEELSALRQKESSLREALFRKMSVFHKLPSLQGESEAKKADAHIRLTADDWKDIVEIVNSSYDGFATRLQQQHPALTEKDVQFCCLVKAGIGLQDLSNIYCVSKAGIIKRKFRVKTEKIGFMDETKSLDDFLRGY